MFRAGLNDDVNDALMLEEGKQHSKGENKVLCIDSFRCARARGEYFIT